MTDYYAYTRSIDPATGERYVKGGTYVQGSPMSQVILRVLRTPKGSCLADPNFGVDCSVIEKPGNNIAATWSAAVKSSLTFLTKPGLITDLSVSVSVEQGRILSYEVVFTDPRMQKKQVLKNLHLPV